MKQLFDNGLKKKILIAILAILISVSSIVLFSLMACVIAWTFTYRKLIRRHVFLSWLTFLSIGFLTFSAINMLIGVCLGLSHLSDPLFVNVAVQFIAWVFVTQIVEKLTSEQRDEPLKIQPHWVTVTITLLIIGTFAAPFIRPNTASEVNYSTMGYDESAHITLYRTDIATRGMYIHNATEIVARINNDLAGYPQGLHYNLALWARGIFAATKNSENNVRDILWIYHAGLTCWYACIILLGAELLTQLAAEFANKRNLDFVSQTMVGSVLIIAYAAIIFAEILYAGETFLANISMFAGLLLSLILYARAEGRSRYVIFGFASLFAIGTVYTWLVSAPAAFGALFIAVLFERPTFVLKPKTSVRRLAFWRQLLAYGLHLRELWILVVAFIASLPQVAIQILYNPGGTGLLNTNGGIPELNQTLYLTITLLLLAAIMASTAFVRRGVSDKAELILARIALLYSPLILAIFFYAYQTLTTGTLTYYFTKSSYMAYFFIILAFGALITWISAILVERIGHLRTLYVGLLIVVTLGMLLSVNKAFLGYTKGDNTYASKPLVQAEAQLIDKGVRPMNIVSYTNRIYEEDMIINLFNSSVDQFTPVVDRQIAYEVQAKRHRAFLNSLSKYTERPTTTYILASNRTLPALRRALPSNGNYRIVVVND